ncbi:hypothetical protein FNF31_01309 [Cafeteria roenbergensis]|uniref:Uncharacterized protein n=1 Tax=Cafeteria roenbergensis TaxID=33653 RepID=A0A5A8DRZ7_CAFRO|nr:hypothetical protein FNF31_01309 [Cafeteria roenbergensis]
MGSSWASRTGTASRPETSSSAQVAGYKPQVTPVSIPQPLHQRAKFLLSEDGAAELRRLKANVAFRAAAEQAGVDLRTVALRPLDAFVRPGDDPAVTVARARQHSRNATASLGFVLAKLPEVESTARNTLKRRRTRESRLRESLERVAANGEMAVAEMEERQRRHMSAIERENEALKERRQQLELERSRIEAKFARTTAARKARRRKWRAARAEKQARVARAIARRREAEQAKQDAARERAEADKQAMEAALARVEAQRQEKIAKAAVANEVSRTSGARARVQEREKRARERLVEHLEERLTRADAVQCEVEQARRHVLSEQWARKEESIAFASAVRKAAEARQKQLVEELEEFRELQAKKAQMEEAVARERQERQKKLTAELHEWRERNRREVFDAPGPSDFVSPETFGKGRRVGGVEREEGASWSRAERVTSMAATAAIAAKLPGPPRHLPFVQPTPGGRVSTSRGVGFTHEVVERAKSLPGPGEYDIQAGEARASARGSRTPGAFSHRVRRAFEDIEANATRVQPIASLPPVDTLRELNRQRLTPKQMIRVADRDGLLSLSASQRVLDSIGPEMAESAGLGASGFLPSQRSPPFAGSGRPSSQKALQSPEATSPHGGFDSGSDGESQASSSGPATSASRRNANRRPLLVPLDAPADAGPAFGVDQRSGAPSGKSSARAGSSGSARSQGAMPSESDETAGHDASHTAGVGGCLLPDTGERPEAVQLGRVRPDAEPLDAPQQVRDDETHPGSNDAGEPPHGPRATDGADGAPVADASLEASAAHVEGPSDGGPDHHCADERGGPSPVLDETTQATLEQPRIEGPESAPEPSPPASEQS